MKKKILASALSCVLISNANCEVNEIKQTDPTNVNSKNFDLHKIKNLDYMTTEEKEKFLNAEIDSDPYDKSFDRFDRTLVEPKFTDNALEQRELNLEALLDECVHLIGEEPNDQYLKLNYEKGVYIFIHIRTLNFDYLNGIQPNYLYGRMRKCTRYLYSEHYYLSDFGYATQDQSKSEIEKKYALIYLYVKEAGLLRKMDYAFYPKSFLREYADQTGLTTFIKEQESNAGHSLKHDELAIQFFGSKVLWLKGFYQFLDDKIIKLKIGEFK